MSDALEAALTHISAFCRRSIRLVTDCHLQPIQVLLDHMKGIVADLIIGTHRENSVTGRLKGRMRDFDSCGVFSVSSSR